MHNIGYGYMKSICIILLKPNMFIFTHIQNLFSDTNILLFSLSHLITSLPPILANHLPYRRHINI